MDAREGQGSGRPKRRTALPIVFIVVGLAVSALTWAVQTGLVHGVEVQWPAYIVGVVAVLFGLVGLMNRDVPLDGRSDTVVLEKGPIRESGLDDTDVAIAERADDYVKSRGRARATVGDGTMVDPGGGGGA